MDYYQILGVEKKSSKDDIKKAFHKLAHKFHPDKQSGDDKKFKEVNEAYQVLSDDKKRAEYDTYGRVFSNGGGGTQGGAGFDGNAFGGFDFGDLFRGAQQGNGSQPDLEDLFQGFFGGGTGRGGSRAKRGRDISIDLEVSFSESIFGTERKVLITKVGTCDTCGGSGAKKGSILTKCSQCGGKGRLMETRRSILGTFTTESECNNCGGSGEVPKEKCIVCNGSGVIKKNQEIVIKIPPGIEDGEMIRLNGQGEAQVKSTPGDLYVKIHVESHPVFTREDNNLVMDLSVKLSDSLLGAVYDVATLDGTIKLKIPQGVTFGEILRVKGKGVPVDKYRRGDLLIRILIKIPARLSKKALDIVEKLREEGL